MSDNDTFEKEGEGLYTVTPPSDRFGDLAQAEFDDFVKLLNVWTAKKARNAKRMKYYNGKTKPVDLGISIPPVLKNLNVSVGWPAKAVNALASRSVFDGFVSKTAEPERLNAVLTDNEFGTLYSQTVRDELIHSCAFFTVTRGDTNEPDVLISAYSAEMASALWDGRKKRIKCGMAVIHVDNTSSEFILFTDADVIRIGCMDGIWKAVRTPHTMGRPLIEPMVFKRSNDRPFGRSRINRAVMSITDDAMRFRVLMEIASEFYVAPQRYILGADQDLFANNSKWEAYIGNYLAVSRDENGDIPEVGHFPQMTMQPLIDYMRQLAANFAGETNIPVSYLGIIHDNPASAEAMHAATEELIIEAQELNASNGVALRNIGLMATAILANSSISALTADQKAILPKFRNPEQPSVVSSSDAIMKQVAAIPWIAETRVALEKLGYTEEEIVRMLSEKTQSEAAAQFVKMIEEQMSKSGKTGE